MATVRALEDITHYFALNEIMEHMKLYDEVEKGYLN